MLLERATAAKEVKRSKENPVIILMLSVNTVAIYLLAVHGCNASLSEIQVTTDSWKERERVIQ